MTKPEQIHFLDRFGRDIAPHADRDEPSLWFQELRLLDNLAPGVTPIRGLRFKRGLNILWAEPEDPATNEGLYRDGLAGHATGKTLFCRILRHLVGEPNYSTKALKDSVEKEFLELWAIASVRVNKVSWVVGRALTGPTPDFAVRAETIDEVLAGELLPKGDYSDFTAAIGQSCASPVEALHPGDAWRHLLPWIGRDQEARFTSAHEWRDTASEADNPQSSAQERQLVMRAVLGLLSSKEPKHRKALQDATALRDREEAKQPALIETASRSRQIAIASTKALLATVAADADLSPLVARLASEREVRDEWVSKQTKKQDTQEVVEARKAQQATIRALQTTRTQIDSRRRELKSVETQRATTMSYAEKAKRGGLVSGSRANEGWCPNKLKIAQDRGCPNTPKSPVDAESALSIEELDKNAAELQTQAIATTDEIARLESSLERLELKESQASDVLDGAIARANAETIRVSREVERFATAEQRVKESISDAAAVAASKSAIEGAIADLEKAKEKLVMLRKEQDDARKVFSEIFADVVQAVMGATVQAEVTLGERGLEPHAQRNGELSGAALETIKTISFDLAAVVASIEGRGQHPRLLIHDGPREADMAQVIYERFFLYAKKMEDSFTSGREPAFQYILTTTTPPPTSMQRGSKWLLGEVLNSKAPETRLLKRNL